MVTNEVSHLYFSQAHFGDVVSVNNDIVQRTGVSQATDPAKSKGKDEAKQTHDSFGRLELAWEKRKRVAEFTVVRWSQPKGCAERREAWPIPTHPQKFCRRVKKRPALKLLEGVKNPGWEPSKSVLERESLKLKKDNI